MIFKNSLKNLFRAWKKSLLFLFLILCVTLVLSVGLTIRYSSGAFLQKCEEEYKTVGILEYMGAQYPDEQTFDPSVAQAIQKLDTSLFADSSVTFFEPCRRALAYTPGFTRTDSDVPYSGYCVAVVRDIVEPQQDGANVNRNGMYRGIVSQMLYGTQDMTEKIVWISAGEHALQQGHTYAVFACASHSGSGYWNLRVLDFANASASAAGAVVESVVDLTDLAGEQLPDDSPLYDVAQTYAVVNNSFSLFATGNLDTVYEFNQGVLYTAKGRSFTQQEYDSGAKVCMISTLAAERLQVDVGDSIPLQIAIGKDTALYESYWAKTGFAYTDTYEIVGLFNETAQTSYYAYVPYDAAVGYEGNTIGYTAARMQLQNSTAAQFYARIKESLPDRFVLTVYDQGYNEAAQFYQSVYQISLLITVICALVTLTVLSLFGFLFVYRQRDTSEIMVLLGVPRGGVIRYFLYSSGMLSLISALAGVTGGYFLCGTVEKVLVQLSAGFNRTDTRYSNAMLTVTKTTPFTVQMEYRQFLLMSAFVFACGVLICLLFAAGTFAGEKAGGKRLYLPKNVRHSSRLRGSPAKYALLSIRRGGAKAWVVTVAVFAVTVLLFELAQSSGFYNGQLQQLYQDTQIEGGFMDIRGRQVTGLVVDKTLVDALEESGCIDTASVSVGAQYRFLGVTKTFGGETRQVPNLPALGGFAEESRYEDILAGSSLVLTNNIRKTGEFYYSRQISMEFLPGYDETMLAAPYNGNACCMVSTAFMQQYGVNLGDSIRVAVVGSRIGTYYYGEMLVAGSFEKAGVKDHIYCALDAYLSGNLLYNEKDERLSANPAAQTYSSVSFCVKTADELSAFKDYMQNLGVSQVGHISSIRSFAVMDDMAFYAKSNGLQQHIRYIGVLYPCLYLLVGVIGLIGSYLLVVNRRREFAIMRGLGARAMRTFLTFFTEQLLLSLVGAGACTAAWVILFGTVSRLQLLLCAVFLLCFYVGSGISIAIMNHASALAILSQED